MTPRHRRDPITLITDWRAALELAEAHPHDGRLRLFARWLGRQVALHAVRRAS